MRTGAVQANLGLLNEAVQLPHVADLLAQKREGVEKQPLGGEVGLHQREFARLQAELRAAAEASALPEVLADERGRELHEFLLRVRLAQR